MKKKTRKLLASFFLFMTSAGSQVHILIHSVLGSLEREVRDLGESNMRQWKRGALFFLRLYERFLPNDDNGNYRE